MNISFLLKPRHKLYTIIIVIGAAISGLISVYLDGEHNAVENIAETVIESELGLPKDSVDLDPKDLKK